MTIFSQAPSEGRRRREVTGRMVLFCLVTFFAVVSAVNAVMIVAAVTTFGGLETASSYKAGLAFGTEIAASRAQQDRAWQVTATLDPQAGGQVRIELAARDAANRPLERTAAMVRLAHPADRRLDRAFDMQPAGGGRFRGEGAAESGQWDLVIELERDGARLFRSRERIIVKIPDRPGQRPTDQP